MKMSKYTTEVRYICEQKSGLDESVGCDDVDVVISKSWNKIFTTQCKIFDENYRSILCSKILKHYYLREIGAETVGIWKLWMNTKLEEIMPYYNQLYESALLEFDPFKDVDYKKEHEGESEDTHSGESNTTKDGSSDYSNSDTRSDSGRTQETGTITDTRTISETGSYSKSGGKSDRYSDTPQGTINNTDVEGDAYLTNVRLIGENESGSNTDNTTDNNTRTLNTTTTNTNTSNASGSGEATSNETIDGTDSYLNQNTNSYLEHIFGKMSSMPYSELLNKFRETFLNIDMLVIEEFDELFLRLW